MREVPRDSKWEESEELTPVLVSGGPTDSEKIIITLLMRLYDLEYAQLYLLNEKVAEEVAESHEKGELGNPKMWIPEFGDPSDASGEQT